MSLAVITPHTAFTYHFIRLIGAISASSSRLLIRQVLFVNLALAEVPKSLDGLKLNGIRTLQ